MGRFILALALAGLLCALDVFAQAEVVARSEAQQLGCLVRPANPPRSSLRSELDRESGTMRVLLKFSKPDAKPLVAVLYNSARESMQDVVLDHVAGYRLPCLRPEDGDVIAVQDFSFRSHDRDPTPMLVDSGADGGPLCVVMPRRDLNYTVGDGQPRAEHLVAHITFSGDGLRPPDVRFAYSNATARYEQAVREWVSEYRMPCRTAKDKPRTVEQRFSMFPEDKRRFSFPKERFSLTEFLALTREPTKVKAYFDLNTMGCPFRVGFVLGGDRYPHVATVPGPTDPNKAVFLHWLESLQFDFKSEEMATDLFSSELQVDIPCGTLDLNGGG